MSPWLFNLYMNDIVREARQKFVGGIQMEETVVHQLLFADMERNLRVLDEVMEKWKMWINGRN